MKSYIIYKGVKYQPIADGFESDASQIMLGRATKVAELAKDLRVAASKNDVKNIENIIGYIRNFLNTLEHNVGVYKKQKAKNK